MVSLEGDLLQPCPSGTIGRVQIRGPGVITEYAAEGGAIDAGGWLETGDLGHLDEDGYLFLAGRSDDVINRGGEKSTRERSRSSCSPSPGSGPPWWSRPARRCSACVRSAT